MLVEHEPTSVKLSADCQWSADHFRLKAGELIVEAPLAVDPAMGRDDEDALARVARGVLPQGWQLTACGGCRRFRSTSLAQQFSGRRAGYCSLVGFRTTRAIVTIDFDCGEYEPAEGWPYDLTSARESRRSLSNVDPIPSRKNARWGTLIASYVFSTSQFEHTSMVAAADDSWSWFDAFPVWQAHGLSLDQIEQGCATLIAKRAHHFDWHSYHLVRLAVCLGLAGGLSHVDLPSQIQRLCSHVGTMEKSVCVALVAQLVTWLLAKRNLTQVENLARQLSAELSVLVEGQLIDQFIRHLGLDNGSDVGQLATDPATAWIHACSEAITDVYRVAQSWEQMESMFMRRYPSVCYHGAEPSAMIARVCFATLHGLTHIPDRVCQTLENRQRLEAIAERAMVDR